MRNAIAIACVIAATALAASGPAQEQGKVKLAPPQVFQPPFPYSLGIAAQGKRTVYVAGQVALNEKGELVGKDDPEAQSRQVFTNMKAVLAAAGAKMDDVVKITMIIKTVRISRKSEVFARSFSRSRTRPARPSLRPYLTQIGWWKSRQWQ